MEKNIQHQPKCPNIIDHCQMHFNCIGIGHTVIEKGKWSMSVKFNVSLNSCVDFVLQFKMLIQEAELTCTKFKGTLCYHM